MRIYRRLAVETCIKYIHTQNVFRCISCVIWSVGRRLNEFIHRFACCPCIYALPDDKRTTTKQVNTVSFSVVALNTTMLCLLSAIAERKLRRINHRINCRGWLGQGNLVWGTTQFCVKSLQSLYKQYGVLARDRRTPKFDAVMGNSWEKR